MLASLLPGLRELRAPLAAGYLWLLSIYLLVAPHVPSEDKAHGIVENLYSLKDAATAVGLGVALSFVAYLVGMLSTGFLNPLLRAAPAWFVRAAGSSRVRWALPARLRRLVDRDYRTDQLSERSWLALNDLVVGSLREVDAVLAPASTTLAALVREEVPTRARSRGGDREGPLERVVDAVADELDLVKTRLLGKEADLFSAVDRHQAERDFRLAVLPPLGVVAVVTAVIADSLLVAPIVAVGSAVVLAGLFRQAVTSDRAGTDVLVDALRLGDRVKSPTLERLAAASRRAAALQPDGPTPPLLDRAVVLGDATSELGSALASIKHLSGQPLDDDSRRRLRVASDGLERLEVYLPQGSRLIQAAREAQRGLRSGSLSEAEWTQLDRHRQTIADLWLIEIERPGRLELLSSDVDALDAALSGSDQQDRLIGVHALREAVSMSTGPRFEKLVRLLRNAITADGPFTPQLVEAFEKAVELGPAEVTKEDWRGVRLEGVVLQNVVLKGIGLPDARLDGAKLAGCDLTLARLNNTSLVGANLRGAILDNAALSYTDLAEADLTGAYLRGAFLESPLVMGVKLAGADLRGAAFEPDPSAIPWQLIEGWRDARLDPEVRSIASEIAGAAPAGRPVLMLTWEAPPLVAGGSWTACYHLVRRLRAVGVDITVVVPWRRDLCEEKPFGADVEVVFAGVEPSVPGAYTASGGPFPPYLPYSAYSPYWWRADGTYPSGYSSAPLLALNQFADWLERWDGLDRFAVVHAHDWVTFPAAERASERARIPWVAHFHSTVADRRPDSIDWLGAERERDIEKHAVEAADAVVVPSAITGRRVAEYAVREIDVVANSLSREAPPPQQVGSLESRRIVFVGRLARQKAPDRFVAIARAAREEISDVEFALIGDGEERRALEQEAAGVVAFVGAKPWSERASAFEKASVVVVPSRSEPFGMVVAEAMQRGVPVLYSGSAGIAEFVDAGVPFSPENIDAAIRELRLLLDGGDWDAVAARQLTAINAFAASRPEQALLDRWRELTGVPIGAAAEASPSVVGSV